MSHIRRYEARGGKKEKIMNEISRKIEEQNRREYQERMEIYKQMEEQYLKEKELEEELKRALEGLNDDPDDLNISGLRLEEPPRKKPLRRRQGGPLDNMQDMNVALLDIK